MIAGHDVIVDQGVIAGHDVIADHGVIAGHDVDGDGPGDFRHDVDAMKFLIRVKNLRQIRRNVPFGIVRYRGHP